MRPWQASGAPARPPGPSSFRVERRGRRPRAKWWTWGVRNVPGLTSVHLAEDFGKLSTHSERMLMPLTPPSIETATDGTGAFSLDFVRRRRVADPITTLDL